ncbi:McrB family protein [Chitinophaga rhizophila]|uniref:AAA domain (Dynein-related subfamily) n=1 Tax=Chitinophaga rhizophila TaxID=2866212 RepID=A0ABS7G9X4_9BACT|nr:hypothetical protein [Chitinophaga rhizophila]MBW8684453.1 hypothetical protein [Chitinophaga rhizophila]
MKRARVYDIRNGDTDYHNMLSPDGNFIFWSEEQLSGSISGEHIFFINRAEGIGLFAIATGVLRRAKLDPVTMKPVFSYLSKTYTCETGEVFRKYTIVQRASIPQQWKWRKAFRHHATANLWVKHDGNTRRLEMIQDLQQIFTDGPAWEQLDRYHVEVTNLEIPVNQSKVKLQLVSPAQNSSSIHSSDSQESVNRPIAFDDTYRKLLMAIRTRPFLLLGGVSGTGKSWTARKLAYLTCTDEALRNVSSPGNFLMVRVRPDWHEPDDLLGYEARQGGLLRYHCTDLLRFIVKAWQYLQVPFFVCLDEMNLAHIEYYFSDYLSILETARTHNGKIAYDPFITGSNVRQYDREDDTFWVQLRVESDYKLQQHFKENGIAMPSNLIVVGTLNMDETTKSLSIRLLDRAMVVEMTRPQLRSVLSAAPEKWEYSEDDKYARLLVAAPLDRVQAYNDNPSIGERIIRELEKLYAILDEPPFELSTRVTHDTLVYCFLHCEMVADMPEEWLYTCLDEIISMRIIVRISGEDEACRPLLNKLIAATKHYPVSNKRLIRMLSMLENGSHTYYW